MTEREIIKSELPKGWTYTTLGEVLNRLSNGITQKQGTRGLPITRIETISKGIIDLERVGYLEGLSPETIEKFRLIYGDILFSHINSDAHLGKTAIVTLLEVKLLHGMNLLLIRVNQDAINSNYLNYLMNYYRYSGIFYSIAQHAVNQSSINQAKLKSLQIPLPPLPEQHRIVARIEELFTRLDTGIEALKKIKLQLKRYRQSVLKSAFSGELTAEWRKANKGELEPASILLEKIKRERKKSVRYKELPPLDTSELPELLEGWVWARVGDISTATGGYAFKSTDFKEIGKYQVLKMANVKVGQLRLGVKPAYIEDLDSSIIDRYSLASGDLVITLTGTRKKRDYGFVAMIMDEPNLLLNQRLARIRFDSPLLPGYFQYALCSEHFQNNFFKHETGNVGQGNIGMDAITLETVAVPPCKEQAEIVAEIEHHFSIAGEIEKSTEQSLKQADKLRQGILKRAFEGKLVSQNPNDESAEKLLERIKAERVKDKIYSKQGGLL